MSVKAGTGRCSVLSCREETFPKTLFKTPVLGLDKLADLNPDPHILTLDKKHTWSDTTLTVTDIHAFIQA